MSSKSIIKVGEERLKNKITTYFQLLEFCSLDPRAFKQGEELVLALPSTSQLLAVASFAFDV